MVSQSLSKYRKKAPLELHALFVGDSGAAGAVFEDSLRLRHVSRYRVRLAEKDQRRIGDVFAVVDQFSVD